MHVKENYLPATVSFNFDTTKVKKLSGISIPLAEIKILLESVGVVIKNETKETLGVQIPSYRFDIQHDADCVEEVVRLYGYDNLKAQPMLAITQAGNASASEGIATQLAQWFKTRGYHETISYSFVDPELQEALYPGRF